MTGHSGPGILTGSDQAVCGWGGRSRTGGRALWLPRRLLFGHRSRQAPTTLRSVCPSCTWGKICHKEKQSPLQVPSCQLGTLLISLMGNFSLTLWRKTLTSHHLTHGSEQLPVSSVCEKQRALQSASQQPGICS